MSQDVIVAVLVSFGISAILCPIVIPFLRRLKFGQQIRQEGPQKHLQKSGTPTMGGVMFLGGIIVTSLLYVKEYSEIVPILFVTVGFGIIGFLDDYLKILKKQSEGLTPIQKLLGQFIITGIFCYYCMTNEQIGTEIIIPFMH